MARKAAVVFGQTLARDFACALSGPRASDDATRQALRDPATKIAPCVDIPRVGFAQCFRDPAWRLRCNAAICLLVLITMLCLCTLANPVVAYADENHSRVAGAGAMASAKALMLEGMQPITADQVNDGTYPIDAESSSPFFKLGDATLVVKDGRMTAEIAFDSKSYPLVFMGTADEAAAAPYEDYIEFDGEAWTFTVPVSALDQEIDCAAWSKRRKQWYNRKLMFYAATLPEGALKVALPEYGEPVESTGANVAKTASDVLQGVTGNENPETGAVPIDMPDGEYSIEVNMTGGSGRASVSSPTWLIVEDGYAYVRLLWSS